MKMRVGIVGAGKVGKALGKYLVSKDVQVVGVYNRNKEKGQAVALTLNVEAFDQIESLVKACDLLFLTVSDGVIEVIWHEIRGFDLKSKLIVHCSGALSSHVFEGIEALGGFGYSLHPVMTLSDAPNAHEVLGSAHFTLEGAEARLPQLKALITDLGNQVHVVKEADKKAIYHCAAVFSSNFIVALAKISTELLKACGFDEEGQRILFPLMEASLENVMNVGIQKALTGPVERCDRATVVKHLAALEDEQMKQLYRLLSKVLIEIAEAKNVDVDYHELKKLIEDDSSFS
ncbi:MAG: DUF2520 domain-containing protein [Defluviitaleaceae bacterium]|nr:DUF2520 domain-containing protein [Defluviitaleaceae bacterium]